MRHLVVHYCHRRLFVVATTMMLILLVRKQQEVRMNVQLFWMAFIITMIVLFLKIERNVIDNNNKHRKAADADEDICDKEKRNTNVSICIYTIQKRKRSYFVFLRGGGCVRFGVVRRGCLDDFYLFAVFCGASVMLLMSTTEPHSVLFVSSSVGFLIPVWLNTTRRDGATQEPLRRPTCS